MKADGATFKVVKEHKGNKTTVTIFDSEENIVTAKKSEFRLEKTENRFIDLAVHYRCTGFAIEAAGDVADGLAEPVLVFH